MKELPPPLRYGEGAVPLRSKAREGARAVWGAVRGVAPSFRDLHVYGGGALVAVGVALAWPPGGWIAFGVLLVYLGLRRP